jgi:hypothetical protein
VDAEMTGRVGAAGGILSTSDYHKNLARVSRLADGAEFPDATMTKANIINVAKYKSGVVQVDERVARKAMLEKLAEKTNL